MQLVGFKLHLGLLGLIFTLCGYIVPLIQVYLKFVAHGKRISIKPETGITSVLLAPDN